MLQPTDHYAQFFAMLVAKQEDSLVVDLTRPLEFSPTPIRFDAVLVPRTVARKTFFDSGDGVLEHWANYCAAVFDCQASRVSYDQIESVYQETDGLEMIRAAYPAFIHENQEHCARVYVVYSVKGKIKTTEVFIPQPQFTFRPDGPVTSKAIWYEAAEQLARLEIWPKHATQAFDDIVVHGLIPIGHRYVQWFRENDDGTYTLTGE